VAQGFSDCWRTVRLYVPAAPTFLVREWVNVAWKQLTASRRWGFLRGELVLTIAASRAISSCVVTTGSPTVTAAGLFVAGDAGRQFQVATYPTYTIQSVTDANTIVLDRAYGEPSSAAAVALVLDAFATMPADFGSFRVIADPYNQRRLAFWITEDQLNVLDPTRMAGDTGPRVLVARAPSTYTPTLGQVQYEYWPRPTAARSYPALYNKQADTLNDTGDRPNPYFNATIARDKQLEFRQGIQSLSLRDDEQYPDDLATVHWERWPLADLAYNDQALRSTDATVADFY
jgi:hypothetical protein